MKNRPSYSILALLDSNDMIQRKSNPAMWEIHNKKPSFPTLIDGNILILCREFYLAIPYHLLPLPCSAMIVIGSEEGMIVGKQANVTCQPTLKEGLAQATSLVEDEKKIFLLVQDILFREALHAHCCYEIAEVFTMQFDQRVENTIQLSLPEEAWVKATLSFMAARKKLLPQIAIHRYRKRTFA